MKKRLKRTIPIIFLCVLGFLSYKLITKINYKNELGLNIQKLPSFSYINIDGSVFSNKNLEDQKSILIIYFNSECEYCQYETEDIKNNIKKLRGSQILFVSNEDLKTIKTFAENYNLINHYNINFLSDSQNTFASSFDAHSFPFILIYDKNRRLVKKIKGQTKLSSILNALENEKE